MPEGCPDMSHIIASIGRPMLAAVALLALAACSSPEKARVQLAVAQAEIPAPAA